MQKLKILGISLKTLEDNNFKCFSYFTLPCLGLKLSLRETRRGKIVKEFQLNRPDQSV